MPTVFIGHGNPMNALEHNQYTEAWRALADAAPPPEGDPLGLRALVRARWRVTADAAAAHDPRLRRLPAGALRRAVPRARLTRSWRATYARPPRPDRRSRWTTAWGLDHGTWSVLVHLYPDADVPVVQLGLDETLTAEQHYEIADPPAAAARTRTS